VRYHTLARRSATLLIAIVITLVATTSRSFAGSDSVTSDPPRYPDALPAIGVSVVADGRDASGRWSQTLRLKIKSGGSLADASLLVYGDLDHVDVIFAAARKTNPHLVSPAVMPVGQQIDLPIDPSTTFALGGLAHQPNALVQSYTNGVVDTLYAKPQGSVIRVITFPAGKPTDAFTYPSANGPVKVRPGGKLVDVVYAQGTSYGDTVRQIFGVTTYLASADLATQIGWSPTNWPPPTGDTHQVAVGPLAAYLVLPPEATPIPNADPTGNAAEQRVQSERRHVGITLTGVESFNQVYHVAVNDPGLKASDVSRLLYNDGAHLGSIAAAAGIAKPNVGSAFDPYLYGLSFDLTIEYVDERFVVRSKAVDDGTVELKLADGAAITTYPPNPSGPLEVIRYPTGYKRVLYRPRPLLLGVANGLAVFHAANNLSLSSSATDQLNRRYVAEIVWRWGTSMPRAAGDLPESIDLVDDPRGAYIDALIAPPLPATPLDRGMDALDWGNPIVAIGALVIAASLLVVAVEALRRRISQPRIRW
jgi:hypothetical protein